MATFWQDVRYGLRMLAKNPGFTAVVALTLGLGIGANTAIFTVLNAVVLRPLPYANSARLAMIWTEFKSAGQGRVPASGPELMVLRERSRLFEDIAGIWVSTGALTGVGEPEQLKVGFVTSNFLSLLGVSPQLGRTFLPNEQGRGREPVIVLSDGLWRRRFGADPHIVGSAIQFQGVACTVIGVMPKDFEVIFPSDSSVPPDIQAWTPFGYELMQLPRDLGFLRAVGRLRPGVTIAQAQAEASGIARQLQSEFTEFSSQGMDLQIVKLHQDAVREIRPTLLALLAGVGMILLIACANVANLLLARATVRQKEITLRSALGATRSRIIRQLLTESVLLSSLGAIAGLAIGRWGLGVLLALRPANLARLSTIRLDGASLAFTAVAGLFTGVVFGLAPVFASRKINLMETIKEGGGSNTRGTYYSRSALVVAEVALGLVLLVGASLMTRTFAKLVNVNPGFRSTHVLTFQIALPEARYRTDKSRQNYYREAEKKISSLPGVQSVGASSHLPFDDYPNWYEYYWPEGATAQEQNTTMADQRAILPGFFQTLGATIVAGRDFNDFDDSTHPNVVIVDDFLAWRTWPGENPLGKKLNVAFIHNGSFDRAWAEVVGIVKHIKYQDLTTETRGQAYVPFAQSAREQLGFAVRTDTNAQSLIGPIRLELDKLDKDVPMAKARPLDDYLAQARAKTRFASTLSALLAGIAFLIATLGIYAVTSFAVAQHTREVGIRMALGAQRTDVLKMILREGMVPVILGVGLGLLVGFGVMPRLASLLFQVSPLDFPTFGGVSIFLFGIGLLACYVPARRAMRVDPMVALHYE
jgi:putative ABC transport system permease protein